MAGHVAQRVYDLYGRFYDLFESIFQRRLGQAIRQMELQPGDRVLDLGVGTGISLEFYPPKVQVIGLDLSVGMLRQAAKKICSGTLQSHHAAHLLQADALCLPFRDATFDGLFMSHVISTVPDPHRVLDEALRVCREGARITLVNHFCSSHALLHWAESAVDPLCRRLGWRSNLSLAALLAPHAPRGSCHLKPHLFQTIHLLKGARSLHIITPPNRSGVVPAAHGMRSGSLPESTA